MKRQMFAFSTFIYFFDLTVVSIKNQNDDRISCQNQVFSMFQDDYFPVCSGSGVPYCGFIQDGDFLYWVCPISLNVYSLEWEFYDL